MSTGTENRDLPRELRETAGLKRHLAEGQMVPGLVSVVVPTYNRAYILPAAIESVLAQSYPDVELIVADDGSTDDTQAVVARYPARVRYVHQPNAGVAAARNLALAQVRGEFVGFLDSDDRWLPWKVEAQVRVLRQCQDVGMIWTDMRAIDEAGRVFRETYLRTFYRAHDAVSIEAECQLRGRLGEVWACAPGELAGRPFFTGDLFSPMLLGSLVHTSTVLLRRDRLARVGGFDTTLGRSGEDYEFHLRTCFEGPVGFLDAASIDYRVGTTDQLTAPSYLVQIAGNNLRTVQRWLTLGRERVTLGPDAIRHRLAQSYAWLGEEEYWAGNHREARGHVWRAVRLGAERWPRMLALLTLTLLPNWIFELAYPAWHALRTRGLRDAPPR